MYIVLRLRNSPAVEMSTKAFELQISSHESSKINKYFVPLFFNESINSKFFHAQTREFRFVFAYNRKEVEDVDKKLNLSNFG